MRIKLKVYGRETVVRHNPAALRVDGTRRYYFLGKGDDCFLSCEAPDVRPRHCAIVVEGDEAVIYAVDPEGLIAINGDRVADSRRMQYGDELQVGSVRFKVLISTEPSPLALPNNLPEQKGPPAQKGAVAQKEAIAAEEPSGDAQIGQWLDSVDSIERARLHANPELRRFHLEPAAKIEARDDTRDVARDDSSEIRKAEEKKTPGKLPPRPPTHSSRSDEAAASTLTRAYGNSIQNLVRKRREE